MSEFPTVNQTQEYQMSFLQKGALFSGMSALLLTGCSSGSAEKQANHPSASPSETTATVDNTCGDINTAVKQENTPKGAGSPESLVPALFTAEKATPDKHVLVSKEKASETLKDQVAHSPLISAALYAVLLDTRNKQQLPNTGTIDSAKSIYEKMEVDAEFQGKVLSELCNAFAPEYLIPTTDFAVTRGQAMIIEAVRKDGKVVELGADVYKLPFTGKVENATQNLQGFRIGFNKDNTQGLSPEQVAIFDKLSNLMLITDDGRLVVNMTFGPNSFKVSDVEVKTPVSIKLSGTQPITVKPQAKPGEAPAGSNTKANNSQSTGNNAGKGGSNGGGVAPGTKPEHNPNGPNTGPSNGTTPEASTGPDTTPNNGGSTPTPGTPKSPDTTPTTPAPGPTTPAPQETTPAPQPSQTTQPPQSPSSSPSPSPRSSAKPTPSASIMPGLRRI